MNRAYKVFIILFFAVAIVSFSGIQIANAAERSAADDVQKIMAILKEQIRHLQEIIAGLIRAMRIKTPPKELSAESYLVADISDKSVILEKNAHIPYPIASITKLMNAVVTLEQIDLENTITLNEEMLKPQGYSPSLFLGLRVSAKNLLKASLIQSTNDASQALSHFVGNERFLNAMNEKAREIGMSNTRFYDAHGLSVENRSTASDLVTLLIYIHQNHPEILTMGKDNDFWLPDPTGRMLKFKNVNNFHEHPEFIGGKTGYLPEAKQSLASLFSINGRTVAVVVLRSLDRQADTMRIIDWVRNSALIDEVS